MLLRRITQHVKEQNWFAVFLDFLIVVFGVFMGFQVQAWSEHRNDAVDTQEYMQRLLTDMQLSVESNDGQIIQSQEQVANLDLVIHALETCELSSENKSRFIKGLYNLGKYDMPVMIMGTIDELNSTGKFTLIEDLELRRLISEAVRKQDGLLAIDRQVVARVGPSVNYVRSYMRFNLSGHNQTSSDIDPATAQFEFSELCTDEKFINAIATVREMRLAAKAFSAQSRGNQIALIEALQKKLGNSVQSQGEGR